MSNIVLDPLSTLIRIALLPYMPRGTKIAILNNSIIYTPPTIIGKLMRTGLHYIGPGCSRSSRDMMHNLRHPIEHAVSWYDDAAELFDNAKEGLSQLKHTYSESGNVKDALALTLAVFDKPKSQITETSETLTELRKSWNKNEIFIVVLMFRQLAETPIPEDYIIECIIKFVDGKQCHLRQIINRPLVGEANGISGEAPNHGQCK